MTQKPKVHVIGSYAVGMTMSTSAFPTEGQTVQGYGFCQLHGGKGSNQAVGAARLGADVMFTAALGDDPLADQALKMLTTEGIRTDTIATMKDAHTGVGFVMVKDQGENEILIDLGANELMRTEQVEAAFNTNYRPDIVLVQLEANIEAAAHALKLARSMGIPTILNPAPYRQAGAELAGLATYITPNQTEAQSLLGIEGEPRHLCEVLAQTYRVQVVLTAGTEGAYIATEKEVLHLPVKKVNVVDTTGAGDCFNAALAVSLAEGNSLEDAVYFANIAATESVQVRGVVESMPDRKTIDRIINKEKHEHEAK